MRAFAAALAEALNRRRARPWVPIAGRQVAAPSRIVRRAATMRVQGRTYLPAVRHPTTKPNPPLASPDRDAARPKRRVCPGGVAVRPPVRRANWRGRNSLILLPDADGYVSPHFTHDFDLKERRRWRLCPLLQAFRKKGKNGGRALEHDPSRLLSAIRRSL